MPSSFAANVPDVVELMHRIPSWRLMEDRPMRLLDVGPGMGKYGVIAREHLRLERLDALEVWEPYLEQFPWTRLLYDDIYIGSLVDFREWAAYDLVLLIDVIEHVPKQAGWEALARLRDAGAFALVSTPRHYPQGPSHGNPHEAHVSEWTGEELIKLTTHGGLRMDNERSLIRLIFPQPWARPEVSTSIWPDSVVSIREIAGAYPYTDPDRNTAQ